MCIVLFDLCESNAGKGMTWKLYGHDSLLDIDKVGCANCDAYNGDTPCTKALPILCVSTCNFNRPPYDSVSPGPFYDGWSGGIFKLTEPVLGTKLMSGSNMNSICQSTFGSSFIAGEHHMGKFVEGMSSRAYFYGSWPGKVEYGGWAARGYGNIKTTSNFWVYIYDLPANCWD